MLFQGFLSVFALIEVTSALPYPTTPASRSGIPISRRSLPLTRQIPRPDFPSKRSFEAKVGGYKISLDGAPLLTAYIVPVEINGKTYNLILDSGSSDLWVPTSNFTCYDATGAVVPLSTCAFGGNFVNASSLLPLPSGVGQQHFNQTYGSGDMIMGDAGLANVTIGGVTVNNQEIVAASAGFWAHADGFNDGIIGFAGPLAEGMYAGPLSSGAQDGTGRQVFYENWIMRAVREGAFDPYFSLALNRPTPQQEQSLNATQDLGQLTLGGLPDIPLTNITVTVPNLNIPLPKRLAPSSASGNVTSTSEAVTNAPITNTSECYIPQNCTVGKVQGAGVWWTVPVDSWNFPGSDALNSSVYETRTILDSGTGLMTLPNEVAERFAAAFDPPATFNSTYSFYLVNCNATIPDFSVTIANVTFSVDKRDLIYSGFSQYLEPGQCVSSVVGSAAVGDLALNLLGDRFLSNVVATHNLVTQEITITQRENY